MPGIFSLGKRRRAAALGHLPCPSPDVGRLEVRWGNEFDRACYLLASPHLASHFGAAYKHLLTALVQETGCTSAELLAHGRKVRSMLLFAEDQLARSGVLANLGPRQKYLYRLPAVKPSF
jgi:hypothetical protein